MILVNLTRYKYIDIIGKRSVVLGSSIQESVLKNRLTYYLNFWGYIRMPVFLLSKLLKLELDENPEYELKSLPDQSDSDSPISS